MLLTPAVAGLLSAPVLEQCPLLRPGRPLLLPVIEWPAVRPVPAAAPAPEALRVIREVAARPTVEAPPQGVAVSPAAGCRAAVAVFPAGAEVAVVVEAAAEGSTLPR